MRSNDAALIDQYNRWQSKKDFLAKVYKMPATTQKDIGVDEKQLEAEVNTIEKELSVKSEIFGRLTDQKFNTWMNIRQSLKAGEAAIEMISTRINSDKEDIYALLIVTQQSQINPDIVILNNRYELEGKLSRYYLNSIKQKVKDEISYNHYWKPVAEKLKGIRKVYFAAEGVYHQINLNTLYNPATGKYLLDEIEVQLVQSTKDIVNRKVISQKIKDVTLFGYPDYNNMRTLEDVKGKSTNEPAASNGAEIIGDTTQRFFNGENILELPGTKIEVETIESLLRQKNIQIHRYVSDSATEGAIKKLNNPAVLHVATHGFFLADINYFGTDTLAGMSSRKLYDNPLLRSGLLFAGVKAAFSATADTQDDSQEDGMLTAYEAMNLHLDQTNLVVLSACETGLGEISNGEGVYGLQRAFQVAGAKSVLMSLWTVSDEATQKLMSLFYENWLNGKPPREAFRVAQLSLRGKYPEPFYWGAFVLVGE